MANMIDYLQWRGDLSFRNAPFNEVDALIFSQLSYMPYDIVYPVWTKKTKISVGEAADALLSAQIERFSTTKPEDDLKFLSAIAHCARFSSLPLYNFVNHIDRQTQKQFSAVCFELDDNTIFTAFRGTDSTLVGWKEDMNMVFESSVPAQTESVAYLNKIGGETRKKLRVGGHSKGGNLAVYASAFCKKSIQNRIIAIYNNDGPGFNEQVFNDERFSAIKSKINTYIPQSSIVGIMMGQHTDFNVIHSSEIGGILQHDPYTWSVLGTSFTREPNVSTSSRVLDLAFKDWMKQIDIRKREKVVDGFYQLFESGDMNTLDDLKKPSNTIVILKAVKDMDAETREALQGAFSALNSSVLKAISQVLPAYKQEREQRDATGNT